MVMRGVFNTRVVRTAIAIIVGVRCCPYLALLRSLRGPFILMGKAMWLVSPLTYSLWLLMGGHSSPLIRKVAVVAPSTNVVMRVVAASLGSNRRRRGLIGCPSARARLLDGS